METGLDKAKLLRCKELAVAYLSDPAKLRLAVVAALIAASVLLVYTPLSGRIEQDARKLSAAHKREQDIVAVEKLRKQVQAYRDRIGREAAADEWVGYLLGGLRKFHVRLRDMESRAPRRVGPYKALVLSMEIEGTYPRLRDFVEWLDTSERMLRVDSLRLEKRPNNLVIKVVVLGLVGKHDPAA